MMIQGRKTLAALAIGNGRGSLNIEGTELGLVSNDGERYNVAIRIAIG